MRFITRDDIESFDQMVDFLRAEGVDLDFDDTDKWAEPVEKLYRKLRDGEVTFGRHPDKPDEFSTWRTCSRILMHTEEERFIQVYKLYKSGKRVELIGSETSPIDTHLAQPGSTIIETARPGESPEETAIRGVLEEFNLSIPPTVLIPHRKPYRKRTDWKWMGGDEPLRDTNPSTVFPCWSTVLSHDFLWPIASRHERIREGVYLHDEDVQIYREWRSW